MAGTPAASAPWAGRLALRVRCRSAAGSRPEVVLICCQARSLHGRGSAAAGVEFPAAAPSRPLLGAEYNALFRPAQGINPVGDHRTCCWVG